MQLFSGQHHLGSSAIIITMKGKLLPVNIQSNKTFYKILLLPTMTSDCILNYLNFIHFILAKWSMTGIFVQMNDHSDKGAEHAIRNLNVQLC